MTKLIKNDPRSVAVPNLTFHFTAWCDLPYEYSEVWSIASFYSSGGCGFVHV